MKFLKLVLLSSCIIFALASQKSANLKSKLQADQAVSHVAEAQLLYLPGAQWNDTECSGKAQSPIDIVEPMTYAENLELNVEKMINNLQPKRALTAKKGTLRMDGIMGTVTTRDPIIYHNEKKDIDLNFQCSRIVFHSPSEHTLYGQSMDVEMQIECELLPKNSVWDYKNRALIISYLYKGDRKLDLSDDKVGLLKGFNIETLDFINHDTFQKMLTTNKFVMYEGSRSSTPCTENVLHIVSHIVYNIPQTDVEKIQTQIMNTFRLPQGNIRPIQPLNGRPLIRNFANAEKPTFRNKPLSFK
jgi:carbonic anhydrase